MSLVQRPTEERELAGIVADAVRKSETIELIGSGTKRRLGRPVHATTLCTTRNLRGITLYEPAEMVISARAGTPLATIEAELAKHGQQLAFEPIDLGPMLSEPAGQATIGGVVGSNLSGSRRIAQGAVRDHVLGIRAVNGRGEVFKAGGRVMKNVTGYDLCRALTGSWGTLGIMTEITLRAVPGPEEVRTLIVVGLPDEIAIEVLCAAMGTPYEVSGTIHLHPPLAKRLRTAQSAAGGHAVTAIRLENFTHALKRRVEELKTELSAYGELEELDHPASLAFWSEVRQLSFLKASTDPVWRISTAPKMGPRVVQAISGYMHCKVAYDWSGGLIWLEVPDSADAGSADIRRVIATRGGHATLVRAPAAVREAVEVFQPLEEGVRKLSLKLKDAFDPAGVLNPGRMYAEM